jgi:hypothetical protein
MNPEQLKERGLTRLVAQIPRNLFEIVKIASIKRCSTLSDLVTEILDEWAAARSEVCDTGGASADRDGSVQQAVGAALDPGVVLGGAAAGAGGRGSDGGGGARGVAVVGGVSEEGEE